VVDLGNRHAARSDDFRGADTARSNGVASTGSTRLLANVYLHYMFDLWAQQWRKRAQGDVIVVRYADDFVVGFRHEADAVRFRADLQERYCARIRACLPLVRRLLREGRVGELVGRRG